MSVIGIDGRAARLPRIHRYSDAELRRTRCLQALRMKRDGVKTKDIADYFGVARSTIYEWLGAIPDEAKRLAAV